MSELELDEFTQEILDTIEILLKMIIETERAVEEKRHSLMANSFDIRKAFKYVDLDRNNVISPEDIKIHLKITVSLF